MSTLSVALGGRRSGDRAADRGREDLHDPRQRLPQRADAEAHEHGLGEGAAALAGDEDVGAGGAFGIGQDAVLLDDERAPQRHHHQHPEDAAGEARAS